MGSLMSGWSSPVQDPKKVKYMRNRSLTRVEIDSYWKSKKKTEEDDEPLRSMSSSVPTTPTTYTRMPSAISEKVFRRSSSMPPINQTHHHFITTQDDPPQLLSKKSACLWMATNSAFLNEPPVLVNESTESRPRLYNSHPKADVRFITSTKPDIGIAI